MTESILERGFWRKKERANLQWVRVWRGIGKMEMIRVSILAFFPNVSFKKMKFFREF